MPQEPHRRPSTPSSIVSETSKVSFSKRLRKVFSMNNMKSNKDLSLLKERNGSIVSIPSSVTSTMSKDSKMSFRRRSIASLTSLFQRHSIQEESVTEEQTKQEIKKKPVLRVDTNQQRKGGMKGKMNTKSSLVPTLTFCSAGRSHNNLIPDSPNSVISSRSSISRLPPPMLPKFIEALPSPTPSSSSSSSASARQHMDDAFRVGLHYPIGLHASPRLRPAAPLPSSSSSSLSSEKKRVIQFCTTVQVHETFSANDYDRRCDANATCQKLTPLSVMKIKQELNEYKLTEMEVHVESRQYTQFFL